ncbi:hypothetical protein MA16_Dca007489 [Dendrobium catenatum]|uniref:Myb-like domain-containing protein n=1 Tax=Dendrobium catenatum TaxID=906689 RepID=A0A2I0WB95_9ASPA|nr:hypothetical protein MA16_Dca007489 [Dendrobium catenatum]
MTAGGSSTLAAGVATAVPRKFNPGSPWTDQETGHLIDAYEERWYSLKRGQLKAQQWEEVAADVATRCGFTIPSKNGTQCRHKIEKLRKRYRSERLRPIRSSWPFFDRIDRMERGPLPISALPAFSEEDEDSGEPRGSNTRSINGILREAVPWKDSRVSRNLGKRKRLTEEQEEDEEEEDDDEENEEDYGGDKQLAVKGETSFSPSFKNKVKTNSEDISVGFASDKGEKVKPSKEMMNDSIGVVNSGSKKVLVVEDLSANDLEEVCTYESGDLGRCIDVNVEMQQRINQDNQQNVWSKNKNIRVADLDFGNCKSVDGEIIPNAVAAIAEEYSYIAQDKEGTNSLSDVNDKELLETTLGEKLKIVKTWNVDSAISIKKRIPKQLRELGPINSNSRSKSLSKKEEECFSLHQGVCEKQWSFFFWDW